jgi:phosphonate transport system substrate-binding protein
VSDYSAIIEAQRAGNVQIAHYGPSSYARARLVTNQGVEVFATFVPADGTRGLYPALYVRAAEPATSVQELKGKNLCLVDPNSTTGNDGPRFYLSKLGIDPGSFFAKVVYAGSHENAVIALQRGTCDAAFTWWGSDQDSMVARMAKKGLVKSDEFRMIAKADIIPTPPIAYLSSLPIDLKHSIQAAFVDAYRKDRAAVDQLWDGQFAGFRAASDEDYAASVDLLRFVDQLHHSR